MIGDLISHYRITGELGSGAMGVVYKAEDTQLDRTVALKFLAPHLLESAEHRERFLREAKTAASLDDRNICMVHEIGEADGQIFLVMGYIDGPELGAKIKERPLPLDEALRIAIEVAEGLRAAHQRGIVHRDIKSSNIMLTSSGQVKILDFGLAQLTGADKLTKTGAMLGTPAYMSPEQARCLPTDERTDIWSLGAVLYEMVTGRVPFSGEREQAVLYSIINEKHEPITAIRAGIPIELDRIVAKALAKKAEERYQHVDDLLVDLRALRKGLGEGTLDGSPNPARKKLLRVGAGAAGVLAVSFAIYYSIALPRAGGGPGAGSTALTQLTSQSGIEWFPSLSPDGKWLLYAGESEGRRKIYLQSIGGQNPIDLSRDSVGDDDQPAFSPDGERIAFQSSRNGGGIFVMGRTGEGAKRVTNMGFKPAWSPDGTQLAFTTVNVEINPQNSTGRSELWTVTVKTGEMRRVSAGDAALASWSPHNHRIAYGGRLGDKPQGDIWTIPAAGGTASQVTNDTARDWNPVWSPDGKHLYFASDRSGSMNLWRVPIDEASGKTKGEPEPIATPAPYLAHPSVSADGKRIVYTSVLVTANIQRLGLDASGVAAGEAKWVTTGSRRWSSPDPSPDGEWVAFYSLIQPDGHIYVAHPDGTSLRQLTGDRANDRLPRWSPDGNWIAFFSNRTGNWEAWKIRPDGSGLHQLTGGGATYLAWSPDGKRVATHNTALKGPNAALLGNSYLFDPNRGIESQIAELLTPREPSSERFFVNSWSPDGERLTGHLSGTGRGIVTYSLHTRAFQRVSEFGEWPVWLPDNRRILFVADGKSFHVADTASGKVRKVYSTTRDVLGPPRLTREGRTAYFSRRVTEADIWIFTLR